MDSVLRETVVGELKHSLALEDVDTEWKRTAMDNSWQVSEAIVWFILHR